MTNVSKLQLVTVFGFPYDESISRPYRIVWSFFPPNLLAKALNILADATSTPDDVGISWNRRAECAPDDYECVITIVSKLIEVQLPNVRNACLVLHIDIDLFVLLICRQNDIYLWLVVTFFLWFALAVYFDNIVPNVAGIRKSMFYFLKPGYWTGKGGNKVEGN